MQDTYSKADKDTASLQIAWHYQKLAGYIFISIPTTTGFNISSSLAYYPLTVVVLPVKDYMHKETEYIDLSRATSAMIEYIVEYIHPAPPRPPTFFLEISTPH
jgi:hypothetical protein